MKSLPYRYLALQWFAGAVLGVLVLHPLTMFIFWIEFNDLLSVPASSAWNFFVNRWQSSLLIELVPMSAMFAVLGALSVHGIGYYTRKLEAEQRRAHSLESELSHHLPSLIDQGEGERLEFKSTLRWDCREQRTNKALEKIIVKSVAGMLNHHGGTLLIGVDDNGQAVGIEADYQTLKHKNSDGFERALMDLIRHSLGSPACTRIHPYFPTLSGMAICQLVVERSDVPIFMQDGNVARYCVRMGNSTREFDAREAHLHIAQRK